MGVNPVDYEMCIKSDFTSSSLMSSCNSNLNEDENWHRPLCYRDTCKLCCATLPVYYQGKIDQ